MATTAIGLTTTTAPNYREIQEVAFLCSSYLKHQFGCKKHNCPLDQSEGPDAKVTLPEFIVHAIATTKLPIRTAFFALFILLRLKATFPAVQCESGHRLFLTSLILASKFLEDDSCNNKAWREAGMKIFSLKLLNTMEREMCRYVSFSFNVTPATLERFERTIRTGYDLRNTRNYPSSEQLISQFREELLDGSSSIRVIHRDIHLYYLPSFATPVEQ